jgi:hypothetical protein
MGKGKGLIVCVLASVFANGAAADEERVVQLKDDPYRHIVLENAVLRVWEAKVPVGEWTPFHEHKADEVSVRINSTVLVNVPKGRFFNFTSESTLESGSVSFNERAGGYIHKISPKGPNSHYVIEAEFVKSDPLSGARRALPSPERAGVTTILDTPRFVASRVVLEPGNAREIAPGMNTLVVVVKGGRASAPSSADAPARELKPGEVQWYSEAGSRSMKNEGSAPIELVEVAVK